MCFVIIYEQLFCTTALPGTINTEIASFYLYLQYITHNMLL